MKDSNEVVSEFNELVNMTATELEKWLKSDDSNSAGWPKEDENGETVGHDSGRKIVEILKDNPDKDPEKYSEDQVAHMRKAVSYCKRHLAQETKGNNAKSPEEVKKTKSYASLKNWGHDFLKAQGDGKQESKSGKKDGDEDEDEDEGVEDAPQEAEKTEDKAESKEAEDDDEDKKAGDKRKTTNGQSGPSKKRETRQGKADKTNDDEDEEEEEEVSEEDGDDDQKEDKSNGAKQSNGQNGNAKKEPNEGGDGGSSTDKGPSKGDTVSWNWGGGQPEGKVLDVKGEKTSITTKNGNEVSRKGDPEDPAVVIDAGKSKAIKSAHELN